jgi:predicted ATPase/DNA-binding SARP family transcriptional activator
MTRLSIRLLGPLQVALDDEPITDFATDKARALLAYLAVESDRPHRRDALAGLLWPEQSQDKARQNLRQTLARLRQAIGDDQDGTGPFLLISRETIQFDLSSDHWLDVAAFTALVEDCKNHRHRKKERCLPCLRRMEQMVALYRGDFLDQFFLEDSEAFEEWGLLTREWLRREAVQALSNLANYRERRRDYTQAREHAWRQVDLDPWREESHRQLMRLLALDGQRSAALAQYETCRRALTEELGVEPAEETTALYEQIHAGEYDVEAGSVHTFTLPRSPTPFVGRAAELEALAERLADPDCRLLALVGPGGIGKTRLALRAAEEQRGLFAQGIAFVPLVSVSSPDLITPAIADALGFSLQGQEDPQAQLLNRLRDREMLLVLDGMEHLLEGRTLLDGILQRAPGVTLLVTSRERLNLREEWAYVLGGLPYPKELSPDKERLSTFGAMELFRQRASQADQRFTLSEGEIPQVARICRLVEGMPLGVELAAAWVAGRSCAELAQEIERSLDALTTPLRNAPERQRSVRATFDYSWSLLTDDERHLFGGLSVFRGGFSETAARQVLNAPPERLAALIDKSLVRRESADRRGVHELLRQFAAEKLEGSAEAAQVNNTHCHYYADFLHLREEALQKKHDQIATEEIGREMGNIHAAWHWAVTQAKWEEVGKSLRGLRFFYLIRGPLHAGETLLEEAVDRLRGWLDEQGGPERAAMLLLARLLVARARFQNRLSQYDRALETAREAALLAQQAKGAEIEATAHIEWGEALWRRGKYEAARQVLERALANARETGQADIEAECLRHIGNTFLIVGDFDQARPRYEQAARICHESGDLLGEAAALDNTACISIHLGRHAEARAYYNQTLRIYREIGDQWNEATVLVNLGELARVMGDLGRARTYYEQSLQGFRAVGSCGGEAVVLLNLGMSLGYLGDYEQAVAYCRQSLHIRRETGDRRGEAIVLSALGLFSHYQGDNETALVYCRQALSMAEELGDRLRQSRTLTRMGHALLGLAQSASGADQRHEYLAQAADAYQRALEMRRELDQASLAVEVLAGLARVSLAQGDSESALARVEEILAFLGAADTDTGHGLEGTTDPFRIYLTCYHVLLAARDPRAGEILATAHNLLQQQAAKIDDEDLRRSFLEGVAAHREIRAAFTGK